MTPLRLVVVRTYLSMFGVAVDISLSTIDPFTYFWPSSLHDQYNVSCHWSRTILLNGNSSDSQSIIIRAIILWYSLIRRDRSWCGSRSLVAVRNKHVTFTVCRKLRFIPITSVRAFECDIRFCFQSHPRWRFSTCRSRCILSFQWRSHPASWPVQVGILFLSPYE